MIADYAASVLEAPQKIGLLAEAPLQVEQANFRAIDNRMWSTLNTPRAQNKSKPMPSTTMAITTIAETSVAAAIT